MLEHILKDRHVKPSLMIVTEIPAQAMYLYIVHPGEMDYWQSSVSYGKISELDGLLPQGLWLGHSLFL